MTVLQLQYSKSSQGCLVRLAAEAKRLRAFFAPVRAGNRHGSTCATSRLHCNLFCGSSRAPANRRARPDGGVVTQRTANPCTPVRFRLGPPFQLPDASKDVHGMPVFRRFYGIVDRVSPG